MEAFIHDMAAITDNENTRCWCPQWWNHPEAVTRLRALYEEYVRAKGANTLSGWLIYRWDAHAKTLFSPTGRFEPCREGHHCFNRHDRYTPRLVTEAIPNGWAPCHE